MIKKISLVLAVLAMLGLAVVLSLSRSGLVMADLMPPAVEVGGGFDYLRLTTSNALGTEPVHYYEFGEAKVLTPTWTLVSTETTVLPGTWTVVITDTARWESVKVGDIVSVTIHTPFWGLAVSPGWFERVPMTPELEVAGTMSDTVFLTSKYAYGDEFIFIGGLVPGEIVSQTLDWQKIGDGMYTVTTTNTGWESFKIGFDRPQLVQVFSPYWEEIMGTDGWIGRSGYVPPQPVCPPEGCKVFLPLVMRPLIVQAPAGFCAGGVAWVVLGGNVGLTDPQCGDGKYVVDLQETKNWFDNFQSAVSFINNRSCTVWFEPADW